MAEGYVHSSPAGFDYSKVSKKLLARISPEKHTISGNFTPQHRLIQLSYPDRCQLQSSIEFLTSLQHDPSVKKVFHSSYGQQPSKPGQYRSSPDRRASMRKDILDTVIRRTETVIGQGNDGDEKVYVDDNPMYEDPRDVIGEKPPKPPRKRNQPQTAVTSPKGSKDKQSLKKKLSRKYEGLIAALIDRCENNVIQISEKDNYISKLKEKLKSVLEYNRLFAEENDQLKHQYTTLVKYVEECKKTIKEEKERNSELESRSKELEERVRRFEVPDREPPQASTAIPLVEVCMSCSSRQIILNQAREHNTRLQKDMSALKDVLYRLNVQLSRYQERLRSNVQTLNSDKEHIYKPSDNLDSLIGASLGYKGNEAATEETHSVKSGGNEDQTNVGRVVDLSGLLSAQALAPLFDAYQENLQEKDSLILDYEKQFENMNKKSKQIVLENKSLSEKVTSLEEELGRMRQNYKKLVVEKETADIEKATLVERAERAESKLKEVYELYENKMAAMMRDYETVHREYFAVKNALEASAGKMAQLDVLRARTVPADLHERRLDHCKRLLEELKHQYGMENERKTEQLKKLEEHLKFVEEKYEKLCKEHELLKAELNTALKNVRLYRKAAVIFRSRAQAAKQRATRVHRSIRKGNSEPLKQALTALERIKGEIKVVKTRAHSSLEELERRIVEQERRAAHAQTEYRRELERATLALEHKEGLIRSLIDKVADVEEVRLSQVNTHRLQGIISDSDSTSPKEQAKTGGKPVSGAGCSHERDRDTKRKSK